MESHTSVDWYKCLLAQFSRMVDDVRRIARTSEVGKGESSAPSAQSSCRSLRGETCFSRYSSKKLNRVTQDWKSPCSQPQSGNPQLAKRDHKKRSNTIFLECSVSTDVVMCVLLSLLRASEEKVWIRSSWLEYRQHFACQKAESVSGLKAPTGGGWRIRHTLSNVHLKFARRVGRLPGAASRTFPVKAST